MFASVNKSTRTTRTTLAIESLEDRVQPAVYNVGPGHTYTALHQVPWDRVDEGDTVKVYWQATPYHDKIVLNNSGSRHAPIKIVGIAGPNGQRPIISAWGAIENPQAKFWSDQVSAQGIFTIAPTGWNGEVSWITISNLELRDALRENWFINAHGQQVSYNVGAAGVALYHAKNITISNCHIQNNENGIFGKSFGFAAGDLRNITIRGNVFQNNGVPNQPHYHNTYIEGINTIYEKNWYYSPKAWSAGCNLKDRGAGTIIRYNWFEGGLRLLDLVDPEDGAPTFLNDPLWGKTYVYGNILVNPPSGGATAIIHFGFDGQWQNAQENLYFYQNTVVNINDQTTGRWYTYVFKCDNDNSTVWAANNIFHSFSPVEGHWSGDFYFMTGGGRLNLHQNWAPSWIMIGDAVRVRGEQTLIKGQNPGFVDAKNKDFRLKKESPCLVGDQSANRWTKQFMPKPVEIEFDFTTGNWVAKANNIALGAVG
jgi:hypothetical protein